MSVAISVIVPVYNEAERVNGLIDHLLGGLSEKPHEIIIVDGSNTRNTLAAVTRPGVRLITSEKGRARQMNAGAKAATGAVLLFLHADTTLPADALSLIGRALADGAVVAGAFDLKIDSGRLCHGIIASAASLRSRLTRIPYGDQAIFARRAYFAALGGFRDIPVMEDVDLMSRIKGRQERIVILRPPVLTSPRRWNREGVIRCTLRNWLLITLYVAGVCPERLAKYYRQ